MPIQKYLISCMHFGEIVVLEEKGETAARIVSGFLAQTLQRNS